MTCGASSCLNRPVKVKRVRRAGWDYDRMVAKLRRGQYAAVISDDTQLEPRARADDSCSLQARPSLGFLFVGAFASLLHAPCTLFRIVFLFK